MLIIYSLWCQTFASHSMWLQQQQQHQQNAALTIYTNTRVTRFTYQKRDYQQIDYNPFLNISYIFHNIPNTGKARGNALRIQLRQCIPQHKTGSILHTYAAGWYFFCIGLSTTAGWCVRGGTVIWWLNILWPPPIHSWICPVGGFLCSAGHYWEGGWHETCSSLLCTESKVLHPP